MYIQQAAFSVPRQWNLEIGADFRARKSFTLGGAGSTKTYGATDDVDGVVIAFSAFAAAALQVANQIDTLHAAGSTKVSRITTAPSRDCSDIAPIRMQNVPGLAKVAPRLIQGGALSVGGSRRTPRSLLGTFMNTAVRFIGVVDIISLKPAPAGATL